MVKNYFCHHLIISVPFLCVIFQSFSCHSALRLSFLQSFLCHSVIALHSSVLCCFQFIGRVLVCVAWLRGGEQLKDEGPGIGAGKGGPAGCWSRGLSDAVGVGGVAGPVGAGRGPGLGERGRSRAGCLKTREFVIFLIFFCNFPIFCHFFVIFLSFHDFLSFFCHLFVVFLVIFCHFPKPL